MNVPYNIFDGVRTVGNAFMHSENFITERRIHMLNGLIGFLHNSNVMLNAEMLFRILIAAVCGAFIGYERTNRGKGAGIRTHTIVAIASCLMMVISQYGFEDFFEKFSIAGVDMRHDPSRIAAQIVSGIGFLGAGMIFIQKNMVTGLTTAAGIWAVSGIGMAIGSGMYFVGIACTIVIFVVQLVLHRHMRITSVPSEERFCFVIDDNADNIDYILSILDEYEISVLNMAYKKTEDNLVEISMIVQCQSGVNKINILRRIYEEKQIKSIKI